MKNFKNALIVSAAALAIAATPTAVFAQAKSNAEAVQDVEKKAQQGAKENQMSPNKGGTATKTETGSNAVMDNEKKAQQGAKENAMSPNKGGTATKSETANQAVQDVEKKSQQGNQPNK